MNCHAEPEQTVCELESCYREYIGKFRTIQAGATIQDSFAGWMGGGKIKEQQNTLLKEYIEKVCGLVAQLCAAAEEFAPGEISPWAERAAEIMLFYEEKNSDLVLALIAMEALAEPLIPLLEKEARVTLCQRYQKRTPRHRMLPNQSKLLKYMKNSIQE